MSLVITTSTSEGIVIGADSRQSYRNRKGMARIGSDNAQKLFQINSRIGVAITGLAFLEDEGILRNISFYIEDFKKKEEVENLSVKDVAEKLHSLLEQKYRPKERFSELEKKINEELTQKGFSEIKINKQNNSLIYQFKDTNNKIQKGSASVEMFVYSVSGFNSDGSFEVYVCNLMGEIKKKRDSNVRGMEYGADWIGQSDVVSRIILGFDPRIQNIKSINETIQRIGKDKFNKEIQEVQYIIQWGTMTLQDAIDFVDLMIKTTSAIQRFSDGIFAEPGGMPGVGGNVDIAVITADQGFIWVSRKNIIHQENKIYIE